LGTAGRTADTHARDAPERGCVPAVKESSCLGMQLKRGGKRHPRLNRGKRPIANKYREGKMKSTLKRELKRA